MKLKEENGKKKLLNVFECVCVFEFEFELVV